MAISVAQNTKVAIEKEVDEGVYVAPTGASSFLQTLAEGLEITPSKELLERNVFSGTIGKIVPRTGTKSVTGTIPTECRAHSTEGSAPEFDKLMEAALGTKRQNTSEITTKSSGNTDDELAIENADIDKFKVGDIILVKESGAYHVSPITAVDDTENACKITLLVAKASGNFSNSVKIAKFTTYTVAESGHPTLSVTKYVDDAVKETAFGCRVTSLNLEQFATGQIPQLSFGIAGIDFNREIDPPDYTPSYDTALPPITLDGKIYMDGTSLDSVGVNELSISIENTVGFATSFTRENGKIASRITERSVTGSFNPYKLTDDISNYTKFIENTQFSLFAYAKNATESAGEVQNIVAVYMPNCIITELGEANQEGLLQETVSFTASRGSTGTANEIYFTFI